MISLILKYSVLTLFIPIALFGQSGSIRGRVIDQISREPLPFANVQVIGTALGASADLEGNFVIQSVPIGTYQLRAALVGYQPVIISDLVVASGKQSQVLVELDQTPIGLGVVEVAGSLFRRNPDAPVSLQRLSAEEIRRAPGGFEDVLRTVAVLPGVSQVDAGRNDLVVRGGAPSENLYVVENVEIPNINHFGTQGSGGGPLSFINLDFVRETAFSTGGFGVRYGDRMSSVLQIDLREGRSDRIGGKGTISATQFGLNLEGPLSENATFALSARRSYLDFIFKAAGFGFVPEYWDLFALSRVRLDPRNTLSVMAIGAIDDVSFFNDDADRRFKNSRVLGTAQNQYASGVTWEHLFGTGFVNVTLGRSFVRYNGVQNDSLLRPIFSNQLDEGETSLRGDAIFRLSGGGRDEISFGVQAKRVTLLSSIALPGFVGSFGDTIDVNIRGVRSVGAKGSAYLQFLTHWLEGLQVVVGGRVDYTSMLGNQFAFSPRASVTWDASAATSLSVSAGVYRQHPSLIWLEADPRNRELDFARADQLILGVEHLLRADLRLRVEGFLKRYREYPASVDRPYLVLSNAGGGFGGSEENFATFGLDHLVSGGRGEAYGLEFLAQKKLSEIPLYAIGSLTLARTRFTPLDGIARPGAYDQRVIASLSGGYRFSEKWEASARFRYASGRPYTPFRPDGTQDPARLYGERMEDFHALDLRVDRRWNFDRWSLTFYVDVQNVYNNAYASGVRWNARERKVETNEGSIGILPSIGLTAEF